MSTADLTQLNMESQSQQQTIVLQKKKLGLIF